MNSLTSTLGSRIRASLPKPSKASVGFVQGVKTRLQNAKRAFDDRLTLLATPKAKLVYEQRPPVMGWLVPRDSARPAQQLEIRQGLNFAVTKDGHLDLTVQAQSASILKIRADESGVFIQPERGDPKRQYHGDEIEIEGSCYTLRTINLQTYRQYIVNNLVVMSLIALLLQPGYVFADETAHHNPIPVLNHTVGEPSELGLTAQGIGRLKKEELKVTALDDDTALLGKPTIVSVNQKNSVNTFLIDTSSLCVHREMEQKINAVLKETIASFAPQSKIHLMSFAKDQRGGTEKSFKTLFTGRNAARVAASESLIKCRDEASAVSALEAVTKAAPLLTTDSAGASKRLFVITSGNFTSAPGFVETVRSSGVEAYFIVYTSLSTARARHVLSSTLGKESPWHLFHWKPSEKIDLTSAISYEYTIAIDDGLTPEQKRDFEQEVVIKAARGEQSLSKPMVISYTQDAGRARMGQAWFWLRWVMGIALVGWLSYKTFLFYRPKYCPKSGFRLLRSWNSSLFPQDEKRPILYVEDNKGYLKAHIINKKHTKIGSGILADLRLSSALAKQSMELAWNGGKTFRLSPKKQQDSFLLNGKPIQCEINLRHGDTIQLGFAKIRFLYA